MLCNVNIRPLWLKSRIIRSNKKSSSIILVEGLELNDNFLMQDTAALVTNDTRYSSIQLFWERLSEKVHATILKGIVGDFKCTVFQRNLKESYGRPLIYVCECWRKVTKVGSTATVVRNSVLIISHITFRDCRVHFILDKLSRNNCMHTVFTKWHGKERNVTKRDAGSPGNCSGHVEEALEDSSLHRALASVDQRLDSAMPLIYQNPLDKYCQNRLCYPVDSDLSNG